MNHTIAEETISLTVTGLANANKVKAVAYRIDSVNSNAMPYAELSERERVRSHLGPSLWIEMGQPQYLLPKQVAQLKVASQLNAQVYRCRTANPLIAQQTMPFSVVNSTTIVFNFTVEPQALINIILL